jgi:hypothetical protein
VVQTVEPWKPPETCGDITGAEINAILSAIERGLDNGQRYSNAPKAAPNRQAWKVVQQHLPNKSEGQCREIIHAWLRSKLIYPEDYDDPVERKKRKGLRVDDSKRPGTIESRQLIYE